MKKLILCCLMMISIMAKAQTGYQIGAIASDFKLKNINGKEVSMANYANAKGFIIVFTCNTCPVAKAYQHRIELLNNKYAGAGFPVIAINTNDPITSPGDSYDKMKELAKEKNFTYAYLEDPDHVYTKKYGAMKTPHVFVLVKSDQGTEVAYIGAIDNDQEDTNAQKTKFVEDAVVAILNGKKPAVNSTKAVGCSIKWKKNASAN